MIQTTNGPVAGTTEKATNTASFGIVIYGEPPTSPASATADHAEPMLALKHLVVVSNAHVVVLAEPVPMVLPRAKLLARLALLCSLQPTSTTPNVGHQRLTLNAARTAVAARWAGGLELGVTLDAELCLEYLTRQGHYPIPMLAGAPPPNCAISASSGGGPAAPIPASAPAPGWAIPG